MLVIGTLGVCPTLPRNSKMRIWTYRTYLISRFFTRFLNNNLIGFVLQFAPINHKSAFLKHLLCRIFGHIDVVFHIITLNCQKYYSWSNLGERTTYIPSIHTKSISGKVCLANNVIFFFIKMIYIYEFIYLSNFSVLTWCDRVSIPDNIQWEHVNTYF